MEVIEKVNHIDAVIYPEFWCSLLYLLAGPLATALLFLYIYPIPAKHVYKHFREQQKSLKAIKVAVEEETPLSLDEHKKLRRRISEMESTFYEELTKKDAEIDRLRSLIESKNTPLNRTTSKAGDTNNQPDRGSKSFPLSDTKHPVITEIVVGDESYQLGQDFIKSEPGSVNVLKLRNDFQYQEKIQVIIKTDKPLLDGQFFQVFDGYSVNKQSGTTFEIHKTDFEKKNAFVVVSQPNPSREGAVMNISNKIQFAF